jgi:hypothetical protein
MLRFDPVFPRISEPPFSLSMKTDDLVIIQRDDLNEMKTIARKLFLLTPPIPNGASLTVIQQRKLIQTENQTN